ncbi:uncharacterized protein LOC110474871 [Lonchura striata]
MARWLIMVAEETWGHFSPFRLPCDEDGGHRPRGGGPGPRTDPPAATQVFCSSLEQWSHVTIGHEKAQHEPLRWQACAVLECRDLGCGSSFPCRVDGGFKGLTCS